MRRGLLGGTFDPVHNGHLALVSAAREGLGLASVCLIPTGVPWMKQGEPRSPGRDRLAMLELAVEGKPGLSVLTTELDRPGNSYTVDTLKELAAGEMAKDELFFLVGADALESMYRWKDPARILQLATVVAVPRDGRHPTLRELERASRLAGERVVWLEMVEVPVSATVLRRRVGEGEDVRDSVPDAVADYIEEHGLYRGGVWAAPQGGTG